MILSRKAPFTGLGMLELGFEGWARVPGRRGGGAGGGAVTGLNCQESLLRVLQGCSLRRIFLHLVPLLGNQEERGTRI